MKGAWFKLLLIVYPRLLSKDCQSLLETPLRQLSIKIGEVTTMQFALRDFSCGLFCAVVDVVVDCKALFLLTWCFIHICCLSLCMCSLQNYATHESTGAFCRWAGYWAGFKLMHNFDAGYTDRNTGRFCLHPRFLEPEITTPSQSADDAQVGYCMLCLCCYTSVSFLCVMVHCCHICQCILI